MAIITNVIDFLCFFVIFIIIIILVLIMDSYLIFHWSVRVMCGLSVWECDNWMKNWLYYLFDGLDNVRWIFLLYFHPFFPSVTKLNGEKWVYLPAPIIFSPFHLNATIKLLKSIMPKSFDSLICSLFLLLIFKLLIFSIIYHKIIKIQPFFFSKLVALYFCLNFDK